MAVKGYYNKIESFALVDGPGVRSVLFLNGCPFRCIYCHNPETWEVDPNSSITPEEAIKQLSKYSPYWKDNGGITVSGGEPLLQVDFLIELAKLAKQKGYSFVIDTAGGPFTKEEPFFSKFKELLKYTDLFLMDIKGIDEELHTKITGKSRINSMEMFHYLNEINFPIWIRYVLVPGYTDNEKTLIKSRDFIRTLSNVQRLEVLPYHPYALAKYTELGIDYKLRDVMSPTKDSIESAESILETEKYTKYLVK